MVSFFSPYPAPPTYSSTFFWKGCDGTLYQEVKGKKKKWEESAVISRGEAEEELSGV